jgi:hypothetical protein
LSNLSKVDPDRISSELVNELHSVLTTSTRDDIPPHQERIRKTQSVLFVDDLTFGLIGEPQADDKNKNHKLKNHTVFSFFFSLHQSRG